MQIIFTEYRQQENLLMRVVSSTILLLRDIWFFCAFARWFCKKIGDFELLHNRPISCKRYCLKQRWNDHNFWLSSKVPKQDHYTGTKNVWVLQIVLVKLFQLWRKFRLTKKLPIELHAKMIFTTLFQLYDKKMAQTVLKMAWEFMLENVWHVRNSDGVSRLVSVSRRVETSLETRFCDSRSRRFQV